MTPTGVERSFSSVRIRQRTGKAWERQPMGFEGELWCTCCDGHGDANEQHVYGELDRHDARLMLEFIVEPPCDRTAQPKRKGHARDAYRGRDPPVLGQESQIDLQAHEEKEENKAEIGRQGQIGHGGRGEDGVGEVGDSPHDARPQQDTSNDFGDDARLADLGERPVKKTAEDEDDGGLVLLIE